MFVKLKSRSLTLALSLVLLVRTSRALAQDNTVDYRKEFYREDNRRMSIDTDSAYFDIGVGANVRLQGQFVIDAIAGATPSGAPPQSQWRYQTYNSYYQSYYNQIFQAVVNDPNNLILYTSGTIPVYSDYTNYIAATNPQIPQQASNNANASYQTLTNNPNYRSTKVPLVTLQDQRKSFSLSTPVTFGIHTITPQVSISQEHDYHSIGVALNYALQLNKKNTTLNAGISHNPDRVRDDSLVTWQSKVSDDFLVGFTQILTPKSYITANFTYGIENGYLADPYRSVMTLFPDPQLNPDDAALMPEIRPRRRTKEIPYVSFTQFIDPLDGSLELGYRFFHDSYDISAHTIELTWHQKIGKRWVLSPGFRYYYQTAASFYNVIFQDANNMPAYYSSDYRLSQMETFTYSMNVNYRVVKHFSLDAGYQRYVMRGLDNITSPSAYPSANVFSVGCRVPF